MGKLPTDQKTDDGRQKTDTTLNSPGPGLTTKEKESLASEERALEEVRRELELAPEVREAGVELRKEEIELPPPLPKMGVSQTGAELPVSPPTITPPLTDDKIITGLGASVWASLLWLANWCLRQLKKAHVKLKKVHGQIVRIVTR